MNSERKQLNECLALDPLDRKVLVGQLLDGLKLQRYVPLLIRRFGLDGGSALTLKEMGEEYDLSAERVRQMEMRALREMREFVNKRPVYAYSEAQLNNHLRWSVEYHKRQKLLKETLREQRLTAAESASERRWAERRERLAAKRRAEEAEEARLAAAKRRAEQEEARFAAIDAAHARVEQKRRLRRAASAE